jgi:sortase A
MRRAKHSRGGTSLGVVVSLGALVLGIGCIGWAVINIGGESLASADAYHSIASIPATSAVKQAAPARDATSSAASRAVTYPRDPVEGDVIGSLSIPALKEKLPIIEGTDDADLKKGVGHFIQSVLPGAQDNCVLSGHRDTVFSKLSQLKIGDVFITQTAAGTFTYAIRRIRIVGKNDRTVIVPTDHAVLTVTTCYPFHFIGSAPDRYVLVADLVTSR